MFGPQVHQCCLLLDFLRKYLHGLIKGGARGFGPLTWPQEKGGEEEKEKRKGASNEGQRKEREKREKKDQH